MLAILIENVIEWMCVITSVRLLSDSHAIRKRPALLLLLLYLGIALITQIFGGWTRYSKMIFYVALYAYCHTLNNERKKAITVYGQVILLIPLGQIVGYYLFVYVFRVSDMYAVGIMSNVLVLAVLVTAGKWGGRAYRIINRNRHIVVFSGAIILLFSVLQLFNIEERLQTNVAGIFFVAAVCFVIVISIWIDVESEKENKEQEIRLYQLYYKSFKSIITDLRRRQHEYDNQLTAIQSLQFSEESDTDIIDLQKQYINEIKKEKMPISLLSSTLNPIITGFLYSKYLEAKENNIQIDYYITDILPEGVSTQEQIEILGILLDNAIDAELDSGNANISVSIIRVNIHIELVINNIFPKIKNSELEKLFDEDVTTKGNGRGIGLSRLKEIANRRDLQIEVSNIILNKENWISFKVIFPNTKK